MHQSVILSPWHYKLSKPLATDQEVKGSRRFWKHRHLGKLITLCLIVGSSNSLTAPLTHIASFFVVLITDNFLPRTSFPAAKPLQIMILLLNLKHRKSDSKPILCKAQNLTCNKLGHLQLFCCLPILFLRTLFI